MLEAHSTRATGPSKPSKPYPDFPLTAHPAGYWCKKIKGKIYYFGPWSDPDGALRKYLEQRDSLQAGVGPRPDPAALTVKDAANAFLNAKQEAVDNGELSPATFLSYHQAAKYLTDSLGKRTLVGDLRPSHFAALRNQLAQRYGPHRIKLLLICVRAVFKYAYDSELIDRPLRFGPGFKGPSKKTMRLHRAAQGPKLFTADEVRRMVAAAPVPIRAMVLLGINAGLGNSDVARLPLSALDLDAGWLDYPRPKTGMPRRCPLWPETVASLREALAARPEPTDPADTAVFITQRGTVTGRAYPAVAVLKRFEYLLHALKINGRKGLGFYTLRHTFRTVADGAKDQPAADFIMGHEVAHMSSVYREGIDDERLKAVAEHVRGWLFPEKVAVE
jgi:integrase